jgi:hypothetical protein
MLNENKEENKNVDTISLIDKILKEHSAPAHVGKPVFESDLKTIEMAGYKGFQKLFGNKVNNDEAQALPINFGSKKQCRHIPDDVRLRMFNFKKMISNAEIMANMNNKSQHVTPEMIMATSIYKDFLAPMLKAYNITDFSTWIPTVNARFYFEEYEIPFLLADSFDQAPMDSTSMYVPGLIGHLEGHEETDAATFGSQSQTQSGFTVVARNNVCHTQITEDLNQDSSPAIIDGIRKDVVAGVARAYEQALTNGDTSQTVTRGDNHFDTDTRALPLTSTFSKAFKGLRRLCYDNDTTLGSGPAVVAYDHGGDTASKTLFENVLNLMGKFASEKDDLAWVIPSTIENQLVTGAIPELFTAFAFGGLASNVTGQVPPVFGVKPIASQYMREDLNQLGVYQSGQTKTCILLFKKSRFKNFVRQAIKVWAAPSLPSSDIMLMTAKMRLSFAGNPQSATEKSIVMGYNIKTS